MFLYPNLDQMNVLIAEFSRDYTSYPLKQFVGEHAIRMISIGGTIAGILDENGDSRDRQTILHILIRPLIENYFWLEYIFDGNDKVIWQARYDEYLASFKSEYKKLYDEPSLPHKSLLESPDTTWVMRNSKDLKSIIAQVRNIHGDRLDYLYFIYRIASFDTHGKSTKAVLDHVFQKPCNFPTLKIKEVIEMMANGHLSIWSKVI